MDQPVLPDIGTAERRGATAVFQLARTSSHGGSYIDRTVAILVLLILLAGCLLVLRPFIAAILWATILCFSTWPTYARLVQYLNGRRGLAALLVTLAIAHCCLYRSCWSA